MSRLLLAAVAGTLVMACHRAADSGSERGVALATPDAPIALHPYFRDLRVVHIQVGADTLTLLLDTGGGATLIIPSVARQQGCTPHGADVGHRMTGEPVTFARCDSLRITVGDWSSLLTPVAVFDVNALLPKELPPVDRVLALDAFREHILTVDWPAASLILRGSGTADSAIEANGIPIRLATGEQGRFFSALVRVGGTKEPLWFLLDSGNLRGTLVAQTALRDSLLPLHTPQKALLAIGGRAPIRLPFTAADLILDGALGTDYLQRSPITLNLRTTPPLRTLPNPRLL